jgi:hypothetical protein
MTRARDVANVLTAASSLATDTETAAAISTHSSAADPHTGYLKESEFNAAGKNYVLNGAFDVWSRGTSVNLSSYPGFSADRWTSYRTGAINYTISRQATGLTGIQYCARVQRNSGDTNTAYIEFTSTLETSQTTQLAGQTVTYSFYARAGSGFSGSANTIGVTLYTNTSSEALYAAFPAMGFPISTGAVLTTSWQRFSHTVTLSSSVTQIAVATNYTPSGTAGANDYYEITGVQVERGSTATPFSRSGGTLQGEISAVAGIDITGTLTSNNVGNTSGYFVAGKNKIINGDFGVWQRGTSFTIDGGKYTADRWYDYSSNPGGSNNTTSQQTFTPGTAPVPGYEGIFYLRGVKSSGTGIGSIAIGTRIEDVRTFAGQTVTLSYWARVASGTAICEPTYILNYGSGGSAAAEPSVGTSAMLTTSWQRFTHTFTLPSVSGKTIGAGSYIAPLPLRILTTSAVTADIWGVQLEAGSVATPFTTATGNQQAELAACQRYYIRYNGGATNAILGGFGGWITTTIFRPVLQLPVPMRIAPSSVDYSSVAVREYQSASAVNATAVSIDQTSPQQVSLNLTTTTRTIGYIGFIQVDNANVNGYIGLSAEL